MQEAVKRFVRICFENSENSEEEKKSKPHGLTLIDMPTGSGKTYNTIQLIAQYLKGEIFQDIPRIFYLTPLNKNVKDAYVELRKTLKSQGKEDLVDSQCLWLRANYQSVLDNFNEIEPDIPNELRKESFYNLKKFVGGYNEVSSGSSDSVSNTKQALETDIKDKFEPAFRRDLKALLSKTCKGKEEKWNKINSDWNWALKLYPSILTDKSRVLFMSMDKFFFLNDSIIAKPYSFINSNLLKGALVFLDEFDASKEFILRSQIDQSTMRKLDLVKYISTLSASFASGKKFPSELFPKPKDGEEKKSSKYAFDELKRVVEECRANGKLDYHFKLENDEKEKRCFIFQDSDLHTVSSTKETPSFSLKNDEEKGLNVIRLEKKGNANVDFFKLIYSLTGALTFSVRSFSMMARNYLNYFNNEKRLRINADMMEPEESVSTILNPFDLDQGIQDVIQCIITSGFNPGLKTKMNKIIGGNIYTNGFRYFDFIDDLSHDTTTTISMCLLSDTPERFMLALASTAMVVGISATATIKTVTGNYNIDYLKSKLGKSYIQLLDEDYQRISSKIADSYKGQYYKINVHNMVSSHSDNEDFAKDLFKTQDNIDILSNKLSCFDNRTHDKPRYLKVLLAIRDFISNDKSKALLIVTNYNMKTSGDQPFSRDVMNDFVQKIKAECGAKDEIVIHVLHGNIYEKEREQYFKDINAGKKVILFTSYPSSGTGQNLQYSIMEGADENASLQKDIDSIYLEKPTNVIINVNLDRRNEEAVLSEKDLIKYLYQAESLSFEGEIRRVKALAMAKKGFKTMMRGDLESKKDIDGGYEYNTRSVNNHIVRTLEQAVGRICRTRDKNKSDVNIYLDSEIFEKVSFDTVKGKLMNREFQKIVDESTKRWPLEKDNLKNCTNKAESKSMSLAKSLSRLKTKASWTNDEMEDWKAIREWVLKHPTCSKRDISENIEFGGLYLGISEEMEPLSSIYFSEGNDGKDDLHIEIAKSDKAKKEISDDECNLCRLVKIPEVKEYFGKKGYATSFKKDEMILLPAAYINLYKGALGEAAGFSILNGRGIRLKPIEGSNEFEKFDYAVDGIDGVYIDFKLWSVDTPENGEELIQKAENKLKAIGGKKAFIVNIVSPNDALKVKDDGRVCRVPNIVKHKGTYLYVDDLKLHELISKINELR